MSCAFKGNPYVDRPYLVIQYQSSMELEQHAAKLQHAVAHGNQNKVNATSQNPPLSSALSVMDIFFGELDIISIQFSLKTSWQTNSHRTLDSSASPFRRHGWSKSRKYVFPDGEKFEARTRSTNLSQELGQALRHQSFEKFVAL